MATTQPTTAALASRGVAANNAKAAAKSSNPAAPTTSSSADLNAAALALSLSSGPPTSVKLDGLAMTKFIKHSKEAHPHTATGLLLGLDLQGALEVTNGFGLPRNSLRADDSSSDDNQRGAAANAGANSGVAAAKKHITSALSLLSSVNADANPVGIYVSSFLGFGTAFTSQVLEGLKVVGSLMDKEGGAGAKGGDGLEKAVVLVHDLAQSAQGNTVIKAFRLSPEFVTAYKANNFTAKG